MSARVESTPVQESSWRPIVIAIVAAVGLATLAVGMVRIAFDDDRPAVTSVGAALWDAQKLEAMEGRVLAEQVASPLWDAQKLEAMEGRVLAEQVTAGAFAPALEPGELKAILEGRATVGLVGEGEPVLTPHVPKRP